MQLPSRMGLICAYVFFAYLLTPIACTSDAMPIIYPIPLQNETTMPEEYRHLPLVGKCCSIDEVLVKDTHGNNICASSNDSSTYFSPLFSEFNRTGALVPGDEYKTFTALVGNPCNQRYMLQPEESNVDEYYLLVNGSIFAPRLDHVPIMLMPGKNYCMEIVPELGLRAFVCFQDVPPPPTDPRVIIYACGLLISVPFLILTIAAYTITPRLRDVHGKALCLYCGCLALAFTTLAITQLASGQLSPQVCVSIAFVIQFSFVACFFWLNVMCIETWALVHHHVNQRSYRRIQPKTLFFYYSIWAWGFPAGLILISMLMDLSPTIPMTYVKPAFGSESCWFRSDAEALPYFYVPVGILLLANMILFIITAIMISRYQQVLALRRLARNHHSDREDQRLFRRLKRVFTVCLVLFFLMGLNWMMELISWGVGGDPFDWTAFDLVNALQGVLVFGLFVLRRPIRDFVWHRIQKIRGINTTELNVGSMDLALLPVINGDIPQRSYNS
ncbi:PREDICTED: G-protein coupled receptor Mth2-like [Trachymyrmex septentrionalis]|nr:PREDICTED: G-protein coupled receptor Mth2-like [Trachymyrmex septentrionalis]XP_018349281.1 PREDICTED: G-protein coupled receptor Mth2-like [Trachymyrmex septentrionalis]XP_018349282.1 PREDICTED: G-protein coupled receptor Mth2-like [Trachymyrmex septentrionalis]